MSLIPYDKDAKIRAAIIESVSVPGQAGFVVLNPDGTNTGGGGGTSDVNVTQVGGVSTATGTGAVNTGTQRVTLGSTSMQSLGSDATGQDAYATIKTPSANASHIDATLTGNNDAIISLDGGSTDHFYIKGGTTKTLDGVTITSGVAIQAKNASAGNNYTNLYITVW